MAGNVPVNDNPKGKRAVDDPARYGYTSREWKRMNEADARQKRRQIRLTAILLLLTLAALFMIYAVYYVMFRSHDYKLALPFDKDRPVFGFEQSLSYSDAARPFTADLAVTDRDVNTNLLSSNALSAGLFDMEGSEVLYAKDVFTTRSPASLTKMMTALVALKYGNPDDLVTVTDTAKDIEYGSSVCDIKTGDVLSLRQLLYGMVIASGNDAAMMVAEHVGGSVSGFVDMMNQEALAIGATRTHFTNPHGLTDSSHYTCVYDLYLIFHAAMRYDMFMDMISRKNFYAEYKNGAGDPVAVTWETTNHYFTGEAQAPEGVVVFGGKTGTTEDAGGCLTVLVKDRYGSPFLSVVMHAADRDTVYTDTNEVLSLIDVTEEKGSA